MYSAIFQAQNKQSSGEIQETAAAHVAESLQVVVSRDEIGEDVVFGAEGKGPPVIAFEAECCFGVGISDVVLLCKLRGGRCWCCLVALLLSSSASLELPCYLISRLQRFSQPCI